MGPRTFVGLSLSVLSSLTLLVTLPATAKAGDPPRSNQQQHQQENRPSPIEHGGLRALIVARRCAAARDRIADLLATDVSIAERASLLELHTMATLWDRSGPPPSLDDASISRAPTTFAPGSAVKWGEELDVARAEIGRGHYFSAVNRLDRLLTDAPDLVEAARAIELRALTRDVLRAASGKPGAPERNTGASSAVGATVVNDDSPPSPSTRRPTSHWYGWQTLIADGAALATTAVAPVGGLALYCTGAPIVHLAHGRIKNAGLSVGLRVAGPFVGGLIGYGIGRAGDGDRGVSYGTAILAFLGLVGGGVGAIVVDHAVIAREPVNEDDKPATASARPPARKAVIGSIRPNGGLRKEGGFDVGIVGVW